VRSDRKRKSNSFEITAKVDVATPAPWLVSAVAEQLNELCQSKERGRRETSTTEEMTCKRFESTPALAILLRADSADAMGFPFFQSIGSASRALILQKTRFEASPFHVSGGTVQDDLGTRIF